MGAATKKKLLRPRCVACAGTGLSSKDGKCVPCDGSGKSNLFRCNRCNRISIRVQYCKHCGCPEMRIV